MFCWHKVAFGDESPSLIDKLKKKYQKTHTIVKSIGTFVAINNNYFFFNVFIPFTI